MRAYTPEDYRMAENRLAIYLMNQVPEDDPTTCGQLAREASAIMGRIGPMLAADVALIRQLRAGESP